jgi:hypothetical protein
VVTTGSGGTQKKAHSTRSQLIINQNSYKKMKKSDQLKVERTAKLDAQNA